MHKFISSIISKSSKKKGKINSLRFWIRPAQISPWWDNFLRRSERLRTPQESFEKLCTKLRPYIQKSKEFRDLISVEKQVVSSLCYLADEGSMRKVASSFVIEKSKIVRHVLFYCRKFYFASI